MVSNKVIQLAIMALLMLLSVWAISALLETRASTRNVILGVAFFLILLATLWRQTSLDVKLLLVVILGYALGGKGFAYVSPFEPVYIGEISLALCLAGFLMRPQALSHIFETPIHKLIWLFLLYAFIHLMFDFSHYKLLAIRDSATAYYALFFIVSYALFQNEVIVDTFEKIMRLAVVFSMFQFGHVLSMWLISPNLGTTGLHPHPDAFIPLLGGASLFFLIKGLEYRKIRYLLPGAYAVGVLCYIKTAAFIALIGIIGASIISGRVKALVAPFVIGSMFGILGVSLAMMVNSEAVLQAVTGGDTARAFGIAEGGEFVGFTEASDTTSWRWGWWMQIWDDTTRMAPFLGQGFGSDISTPFLGDNEWGRNVRYPHNIMFTVIGRLGLIGLFIFVLLYLAIVLHSLRFCKRFFSSPDRRDADLIAFGVVFAGLVNSLLQATYEVPYAAITHWVCLGYMAARYYKRRPEVVSVQGEATAT